MHRCLIKCDEDEVIYVVEPPFGKLFMDKKRTQEDLDYLMEEYKTFGNVCIKGFARIEFISSSYSSLSTHVEELIQKEIRRQVKFFTTKMDNVRKQGALLQEAFPETLRPLNSAGMNYLWESERKMKVYSEGHYEFEGLHETPFIAPEWRCANNAEKSKYYIKWYEPAEYTNPAHMETFWKPD